MVTQQKDTGITIFLEKFAIYPTPTKAINVYREESFPGSIYRESTNRGAQYFYNILVAFLVSSEIDMLNLLRTIVGFHTEKIADSYSYVHSRIAPSFEPLRRRVLQASGGASSIPPSSIATTVYVNLFVIFMVMAVFELFRKINRLYLCRRTKERVRKGRVPKAPSGVPLSWFGMIFPVKDDDFLKMAGLDAYVLMRYIRACMKITGFYSVLGAMILMPVYYTGFDGLNAGSEWSKYTIANVSNEGDGKTNERLWAAVVMTYVFAAGFCTIMRDEYKHFLERRVEYFEKGGDPETKLQTYFTVMVDHVPVGLRSKAALEIFFDSLFPDQVYCVEMAYDLTMLDQAIKKRNKIRDSLEDYIALWRGQQLATGDESRPVSTVWPGGTPPTIVPYSTRSLICCGLSIHEYDTINYLAAALTDANDEVVRLQASYFSGKAVMEMDANDLAAASGDEATFESTKLVRNIEATFKKGMAGLRLPAELFEKKLKIFQNALLKKKDTATARLSQRELYRDSDKSDMRATESIGLMDKSSTGLMDPLISSSHTVNVPPGSSLPVSTKSIGKMEISTSGSAPSSLVDSNGFNNPIHTPNSSPQQTIGEENEYGMFRDVSTPHRPNTARLESPSTASTSVPNSALVDESDNKSAHSGSEHTLAESVGNFFGGVSYAAGSIAKQGGNVGKIAFGGILSTLHAGLKDLEMLTIGSDYKTSSTAFVTFKTRVATGMAYQMFLSTDHYTMKISPAPQHGDIIWENVASTQEQVDARKTVADFLVFVGAFFWSGVVAFIATISNLSSLSEKYEWIKEYQGTYFYEILNSYLAAILLLTVLAILPFIFYFCARLYEGIKLESRIQDSVMSRYFWYQLVNVVISIGLGSVLTNLTGSNGILQNPSQIFEILGKQVPNFSVYFTNLIIVKTFTAVPFEMLRPWPLIVYSWLKCVINEKCCSWRYLHTGIFAAPVMDYAWIYPSLLMILMIINVYACIAPAVVPFAFIYFFFAYQMYRYQLLYVFQNDYQSGGHLWFKVFKYSMWSLIMGCLTVLAYFAILNSSNGGTGFLSAPFYCLLPLPILVFYYQKDCEDQFKGPSIQMSLDSSVKRDMMYKRYLQCKAGADVKGAPRTYKVDIDEDNETFVRTVDSEPVERNSVTAENFWDTGEEIPLESFNMQLFMQPSLAEPLGVPIPYRKMHDMSNLDVGSQCEITVPSLDDALNGAAPPTDDVEASITHESEKARPPSMHSDRVSMRGSMKVSEKYNVTHEFLGSKVDENGMDEDDAPEGQEDDFLSSGNVWIASGPNNDSNDDDDSAV